jgi:Lrp/AsnC family leucine-responsive transcriptional regulator
VISLDRTDLKIIAALLEDGRKKWTDLAGDLGLSSPSVAERVRKLEESQIIRGYGALVAPKALGLSLTAFIEVTLRHPRYRAPFLDLTAQRSEIQECHHVAGDFDFLLKVRCRDTEHLDRLISEGIKSLRGVLRTKTTIVLSSVKETLALPLFPEEQP